MLKRIIITLLVLVGLLTLMSCGNDTTESESKTEHISEQDQYVSDMREAFLGSDDLTDGDIQTIGKELCGTLDEGYPFQSLIMAAEKDGMAKSDMTQILHLSVPMYCPQHKKAMDLNLP